MLTPASLSATLNQLYAPEIASQINNLTTLFSALPKKADFDGQQNIAWDAQVALNPSSASYASGADFIFAGNENATEVSAILGWKRYRALFQVSGDALAVAAQNGPTAYKNLFDKQINDAVLSLARNLGTDVYLDGTGNSGLNMSGVAAAIGSATGSYATVSRSTYTNWAAYVSANGGTPRALTKVLLDTAETAVFVASGFQFDAIYTTPALAQTYESLFTTVGVNSIIRTEANQGSYGMGAHDLFYKGKPVIRDPNCPAGTLLMVRYGSWAYQQLSPVTNAAGMQLVKANAALKSQNGEMGLMAAIEMLGQTGDAYKGYVKVYGNLQCTNPNWNATIKDLT